ncbi:MAG: metal-sensing transcriptional repressor [Clostridium sp.]|jgi:DNA-binding FrmR family transcriptional regulator|nr:metal-sensing transcriptional repressor [Clostridium sp.]
MEDKKTVLNRLNRLEGQIRGIHKMISDERDCQDIVIQLSAVKAGADKIMTMLVMDNLLQTVNTEDETVQRDKVEAALKLIFKSKS